MRAGRHVRFAATPRGGDGHSSRSLNSSGLLGGGGGGGGFGSSGGGGGGVDRSDRGGGDRSDRSSNGNGSSGGASGASGGGGGGGGGGWLGSSAPQGSSREAERDDNTSAVKVAVRVRPFSASERADGCRAIVRMKSQNTYLVDPSGLGDSDEDLYTREFCYDYSYWSFDKVGWSAPPE
jgi:hypothetical protein